MTQSNTIIGGAITPINWRDWLSWQEHFANP